MRGACGRPVSDRWTEVTESEYVWEQEALDYLGRFLPDRDPYRVWSNFEFIAQNGFINEVDALVVSRSRIYLVEIKSRPGRLTGDQGTWTWHREGRRPLVEDNPRKLANLKAKRLKIRSSMTNIVWLSLTPVDFPCLQNKKNPIEGSFFYFFTLKAR